MHATRALLARCEQTGEAPYIVLCATPSSSSANVQVYHPPGMCPVEVGEILLECAKEMLQAEHTCGQANGKPSEVM
jgi:hypothetical protein